MGRCSNYFLGAPSQRGGAMVELVVLMLVFIPLILLPMYFQDAMRYKLDYQEAVSSAVWDFAYQNYEDKKIDQVKGAVESSNQNIYANLWSGNNRAKLDPAGPWADFQWEREIACKGQKDFGKCYSLEAGSFHGEYTNGGLASCEGTIAVRNHYIPRMFLQPDFTKKNLFDPGKNSLVYPAYQFGVLVDPWSVTGCQDNGKCPRKKSETKKFDVEKDGQGEHPAKEFYERVEYVWSKGISMVSFNYFRIMWFAFLGKMMGDQLGGFMIFLLDNPYVLKLTSIHLPDKEYKLDGRPGGGGRSKFWVTPYKDGENNEYEKTFKARKSYYLGCKQFGPDC